MRVKIDAAISHGCCFDSSLEYNDECLVSTINYDAWIHVLNKARQPEA